MDVVTKNMGGGEKVLGDSDHCAHERMKSSLLKMGALGISRQHILKHVFQNWIESVDNNFTLLGGMLKSLYFS